jgi:molecular chaperone HscB
MLCVHCKAIQPPDAKADYFRVFGIATQFAINVVDLERRYKEMTKVLHPDRFARADARARRASLERSVQLNEAWQTLKDPVRRAEYLLSLNGIDVGEMTGVGKPGQSDEHATLPVPQILLMEVLELREALSDAHAAKDLIETEALIAKVRSRLDTVMDDVAKGFLATPAEFGTIATRLVTLRYYRRFLDEARVLWEEVTPGAEGNGSDAG